MRITIVETRSSVALAGSTRDVLEVLRRARDGRRPRGDLPLARFLEAAIPTPWSIAARP